MYDLAQFDNEPVLNAVIRAAKSDPRSPKDFATAFFRTCMEGQGDVNRFFGTPV